MLAVAVALAVAVSLLVLAVGVAFWAPPGSKPSLAAPAPNSSVEGRTEVVVYLDADQAPPELIRYIESMAGVEVVTFIARQQAQSLPPALRLYQGQHSAVLLVRVTNNATALLLIQRLTGHPNVRGVRTI